MDSIFLPVIIPIGLGLILALFAVSLLIDKNWLVLIPILFIVPAAVMFLRYPFVAVLIWILVFPFFVQQTIPGSRYMYWVLHRAMIPAAFGLTLLSELLNTEKRRRLRLGAAEVSMVLFLVLSVFNILLLDADPASSLIRYYDRIFVPFCMYGLVRLTEIKDKDLRWLAIIAPVPIITQSVIGLMSWFAPGKLPSAWLNRLGERTVGTFGTPGVLTIVVVFFGLLLFQYAVQSKSFWIRMGCYALVALSLFMVFFTFSRGSWLGALIVSVGLLFLYPRVTFRFGVTLLVLFAIAFLTEFRTFLTFANQRLLTQSTAQGRVIGDLATLHVIEINPLFGVGYNNQDLYDEQFRGRALDFAVNNAHTSHNTYLLIAAEMGIVGLLLYMFPLLWWWLASRKAQKRMPQYGFISRRMLMMLWLLFFCYIAVAMFTDMYQSNLFATTMWWMIMALVANLAMPYLEPATAQQRALTAHSEPARG